MRIWRYEKKKIDTPKEFSSYRDPCYRIGDGFLILYSVTDKYSFYSVQDEIEKIYRAKDVDDYPIIVIGNKIDLEEERNVSYEQGKELVDKYQKILFFEMSVKLCVNVEEVFYAIVGEINKSQNIELRNNSIENKKDCLMM